MTDKPADKPILERIDEAIHIVEDFAKPATDEVRPSKEWRLRQIKETLSLCKTALSPRPLDEGAKELSSRFDTVLNILYEQDWDNYDDCLEELEKIQIGIRALHTALEGKQAEAKRLQEENKFLLVAVDAAMADTKYFEDKYNQFVLKGEKE